MIVKDWDKCLSHIISDNSAEDLYQSWDCWCHYNDDKFKDYEVFNSFSGFTFSHVFGMLKRLREDGEDMDDYINDDNDSITIFAAYIKLFSLPLAAATYDTEQHNKLESLDYKIAEKVNIIQKAWTKCRWNPEYKMCRTCQIKDLTENCNVKIDDDGNFIFNNK